MSLSWRPSPIGTVDSDQVSLATGASGANFLACGALLRPGDEVLVERPVYDPLLGIPRFLGARIRRFDRVFEEGFRWIPIGWPRPSPRRPA